MPVMIPINIQDVPQFPVFNVDEYVAQVSKYATDLWKAMSVKEVVKASRTHTLMSDEDLARELSSRPDYAATTHDDMSVLTKEDYNHFTRSHRAMKGIEKWL